MNRWNNFEDQFRKMEREVERLLGSKAINFMQVDWKLKDEEVVVRLYIPGLIEEHTIDLQAQDRQLFIQGEVEQKKKLSPYRVDRIRSSFIRTISLPVSIDSAGMQTKVDRAKSIVMIYLPRKREKQMIKDFKLK